MSDTINIVRITIYKSPDVVISNCDWQLNGKLKGVAKTHGCKINEIIGLEYTSMLKTEFDTLNNHNNE